MKMIASSSTAVNEIVALSKLVGKDVSEIWRHIKTKTLDWRHLEKMQRFLGVGKGGRTTKRKRGWGESERSSESEDAGSSKKKKRKKRRSGDSSASGSGSGKQRERGGGGT